MPKVHLRCLFAALALLIAASFSFAQEQVLPVPLGTRLDLTLNTPFMARCVR